MLFSILVFFQILSGLVAGESSIRQTPEGQKSIDALSKSGLFFIHWRANANYKQDLVGIRNIFGITALIFAVLLFTIGPTEPPSLFNAIPGFFLVLWMTMQFGINFKKSVTEQFSIVGLFVIGPWLVLLMDYLTDFQFNQFRTMASPFNIFGIQEFDNYKIALIFSMLGAITGLFMTLVSTILFSIVPLLFLFLMVMLSSVSKAALRVSPRAAKNLALLYCFLIGPIIMALESKGLI